MVILFHDPMDVHYFQQMGCFAILITLEYQPAITNLACYNYGNGHAVVQKIRLLSLVYFHNFSEEEMTDIGNFSVTLNPALKLAERATLFYAQTTKCLFVSKTVPLLEEARRIGINAEDTEVACNNFLNKTA